MFKTLIDPFTSLPDAVDRQRFVWPLLAVCLAVSFSGLCFGLRLNPKPDVVRQMEQSGELAKASERELGEAVEQAQRIALVGGVAYGLFLMPIWALLMGLALKLSAWVLSRKVTYMKVFSVAVWALLPVAVSHVLRGVVALQQPVLSASMEKTLIPSSLAAWVVNVSPKVSSFLAQVDFFNLWSVMLLGLGFAAATRMKRMQGVAVSTVLYLMLSVLQIGLPALMAQGSKGPMS